MSDLSLEEIEKTLNEEFVSDQRVLVFWYDEYQEFKTSAKNLMLKDAKIHYLKEDNTFATKVLLEHEDMKSNYLIYAPFKRPDDTANHLADMLYYSKEFTAEKTALIIQEMNLPFKFKSVLDKHRVFFDSQKRQNDFVNLVIDSATKDDLRIGMMSVLMGQRNVRFEDIAKQLVVFNREKREEFFHELNRFNLVESFWDQISQHFSYQEDQRSFERFIISLFVTYAALQLEDESVFSTHSNYILSKGGSVLTFLDRIKNDKNDFGIFNERSSYVLGYLGGADYFKDVDKQTLIEMDVFTAADEILIDWIYDHIIAGNLDVSLGQYDLSGLCDYRQTKHFAEEYSNDYNLLKSSILLLQSLDQDYPFGFKEVMDHYISDGYKTDKYYRHFIRALDNIYDDEKYEKLFDYIETKYTSYLNSLVPDFTSKYTQEIDVLNQRSFYNRYITDSPVKTAVIISDAFRYEAGVELFEDLSEENRYETTIDSMMSVVPSYTALGMSALLPHEDLSINEEFDVLVDGKTTSGLKKRQKILISKNEDSVAIQADRLMNMKIKEAREIFQGKSVIYVYHNKIDAIGDSFITENEVFEATAEAIQEIKEIVKRLSASLSVSRILVTADHGYIYTRSKNQEHEKIERFFDREDYINRRFIISKKSYDEVGVKTYSLEDDFNINSPHYVHVPLSYYVFKTQGGGQNFYHGGISPQENIVPVLDIRAKRGSVKVQDVPISILGKMDQINSLIVNVEIFQNETIGEEYQATDYRVLFEDEQGNAISNEIIYHANSQSSSSKNRITALSFNLKNQVYNTKESYYFVARNSKTNLEEIKKQVKIDIVFADDFGF